MENVNPLTSKERPTDTEINLLQQYHGLAIRRNGDDAEKMERALWAVYLYKLSNDSDPQHRLFPDGGES